MIKELIRAFSLIFVAEMGDKTQIIAMTFATQYKVKEVISGVVIGVILNHGIAIILGRFLSKVIPMNLIQIIAGLMFVIFGIMALKDEEMDDANNKRIFSPVVTVALAFFIGELGDKTQLTAMTLSTEGNYPLFILIGSTLGMVATSGLGIFVGSRIGDKIPEMFIKLASSIVFILFGSIKLANTLPKAYINILNIVLYLSGIIIIELYLVKKLIVNRGKHEKSPMQQISLELYNQTKLLKEKLDSICLGKENCGECIGSHCLIGYTRFILNEARENENYYSEVNVDINSLIKKEYDINKVIEALSMIILDSINNGWNKEEDFVVNKIKSSLEIILFGGKLNHTVELETYLKETKMRNNKYGLLLEKRINSILH
ncbi:TMEM165/GDT1 family protein [Tissierella sp.]|uniref:TMEM165/GDT1 family protein n=1 Tax=Tissierella sp. TaxID=41274 RepID=UPI00285750AE|nr:TMEM165/GDT1 family protein [Tissierella sp.]MDR7857308.1 TMEM165/GDT1 family protein [Tissierella sp.]